MTAEAEFVSVVEAAALVGVSDITVRRAIARKELVYRSERGTTKLLRASEVQEWARERLKSRGIEPN